VKRDAGILPCPYCREGHSPDAAFCPSTGRILHRAHRLSGKSIEKVFRLGPMVAEGRSSVIYECENQTTRILFAARCFKISLADAEDLAPAVERFVREVRAVELTAHRNIIEVEAVGATDEGIPYVITEMLRGSDMRAFVGEYGTIPLGDAGAIMEQILEALDEVHARGIVHRSLTPSSIFLAAQAKGAAIPKILDFGAWILQPHVVEGDAAVSKEEGDDDHYLSPERLLSAARAGHTSDLYSAGAILYTMITGHVPIRSADRENGSAQAIADPREHVPGLPDPVANFIMLSLSANPASRFQSAGEMLREMRSLDLRSARRAKPSRKTVAGPLKKKPQGTAPAKEVQTPHHKDYSTTRRVRVIRVDVDPKDRKKSPP
jgi:serine/threonine protein kinase